MFGNNAPFTYSPRGFSPEDLPRQRQAYQQDDLNSSPLQRNGMSRPSGRRIYMQRKEYAESLNRQPDNFHTRVEHLFTCELDGLQVRTENDCVEKLKKLDTKGRLWPQEMIMEIQGGYVVLSDIETKMELESLPLSSIMKTQAVLDRCTYDSLLTITVQERNKCTPQVFMFQCEETGAALIKEDLDKAVKKGVPNMEPRREKFDIRNDLENIIGQHAQGSHWPRPVLRDLTPPPPDHPPPQWGNREPEGMLIPRVQTPRVQTPQEDILHHPDPQDYQSSLGVAPEHTDTDRDTEILNHVLGDLEIFLAKVSAAANAPPLQSEEKSQKKKMFMKKKSKKNAPAPPPVFNLPPWEEYVSCLQKVKFGFNLLGQLDRTLTSPSAPDFVHILFSSLGTVVPQYPRDLPPTVVSPLLTDAAIQLLSQVVAPEEYQLWGSLGDPWNIPRSQWPDPDVPPYIPDFYDGWQPPPPRRMPSPLPHNRALSRSNSQHFPPGPPQGQMYEGQGFPPRSRPEEPMTNAPWGPPPPMTNAPWGPSPPPMHSSEPPLQMRVIYDFMAKNNQELTIMKGEVVEVIQKSKRWWLVRNSRNEEGSVPQNVLEPMNSGRPMEDVQRDSRFPVTLDMSSKPAQVKAWLQYKGFSKLTVSSLGVLTGEMLLMMKNDEIRTVCPEEGSKVFFQLQAVKANIALANEPPGMYNGRY